ncbi:MAG: aldehyde ferredoxin oxidoreductase family protein [Candidatus Geothermarchaeales archaeon]
MKGINPGLGYAGQILYVDLTKGSTRRKPLEKDFATTYIGMTGFNAKLIYDLVETGTKPLSQENVLVFSAGVLSGTGAPSTPKTEASAKSPATGLYGSSVGGMLGPMLKWAGYDSLVIRGRAERPVYLEVFDDEVNIREAGHLWGRHIVDATNALWDELGDDYYVACIGPAGENLVKFANILVNRMFHFSRTGLGAVMGSKNLKAVAVKGTKGLGVADPEKFMELTSKLFDKIVKHTGREVWNSLGTLISYDMWFGMKPGVGHAPRKNSQEDPSLGAKIFDPETYLKRIKGGSLACLNCPISEKVWVEVKGGRYDNLAFPASDSAGLSVIHGQQLALESFDDSVKFFELCNRYGVDVFSCSATIAFAIELYKRGIIDKVDADGLELEWGDMETIQKLLEKIVLREGIGGVLAEDVGAASKIIGKGSERYAIHVKGIAIPYFEPRVRLCTDVFGAVTSIIGGHGNRAMSLDLMPRERESIIRFCEMAGFPEDAIDRICPPTSLGESVPRLTKWVEDFNTAIWSLGVCTRPPIARVYGLEVCSDLYSAATGIEMSPSELLRAGERIWNLQKAFNMREAGGEATRKNDVFAERMYRDSIYVSGHDKDYEPLEPHLIEKMLDEYYEERGWDVERGIPTKQKLVELGLRSVAEELEKVLP